MIYDVKEFLKKFFSSRLFVLAAVLILMFAILLGRIFSLQIVNGEAYQNKFAEMIQKTLSVEAARGNIYDCNNRLLAYNELAYNVTISDTGTYLSNRSKNLALNAELAELIETLEANGETIKNNFAISMDAAGNYSFNVSGSALKRFLADVFGAASYDDLKYNTEFDFNEQDATAEQVMQFLMYNTKSPGYFLYPKSASPVEYSDRMNYEITVIRYAMLANRYTKFKSTTIAENVSDTTVAYISEHSDTLTGINIEEDTIRKYNDSVYFSGIIGYTGRITESEYASLSENDSSYTLNDTVGRSGLEQYYESYLRGTNGKKEVYVDNVGRISEVISSVEPIAGNDLYLSIDAELQIATYKLLEQEIASIVYSNIMSGNIAIKDVYFALINNNVIDITDFAGDGASETEQRVQSIFEARRAEVISQLTDELLSSEPLANNDMPEDMLDYFTDAISLLKDKDILLTGEIDTNDPVYIDWKNGKLSPQEYLKYCISQQWIDITLIHIDEKYADSEEIYQALCTILAEELQEYKAFSKSIYKYLIEDGSVNGTDLCLILFDQNVLPYEEETVAKLSSGSLSAYSFLCEKINNIEITPAQLALEPCTGSTVITDTATGQIKALVSYPGFDLNKMANGVDAEYYAKQMEDLSSPQYNHATQERTAPGSTFKMVTSTAGLAEGIITTETEIECTGQFKEISNEPKCWIHPGKHGILNVSEALRDSCNCFYYSVAYQLSSKNSGTYNDPDGISYLQKYAKLYGLGEKTGLEIEENTSEIADEYPVMAAIGQSNNNFTTVGLARYVTAVTTGKLYDYQLMNKIVDADGKVVAFYSPEYSDISYVLDDAQWDAIHDGMRRVCSEHLSIFKDFEIDVAGKTGTAQQEGHANHALFVGYAPYENPEITIATRIAYGYTSNNAVAVSRNILAYYFGTRTLEDILSGNAEGAGGSGNNAFSD